jgi:hypothetical protein
MLPRLLLSLVTTFSGYFQMQQSSYTFDLELTKMMEPGPAAVLRLVETAISICIPQV